MPTQQKYDLMSDDFLRVVAEGGRQLKVFERTLYVYEHGAWTVASPMQLDELDKVMAAVCTEQNFPFSEKYTQAWRTVKVRVELLDGQGLDKEPLIVLPNGTLDVMTGDLYDHSPDLLTTRQVAIPYDPDAECPRWLEALDRIVEDKTAEVAQQYKEFLQQWFGLALVGFESVNNARGMRKLLVLHGPHGSAKSSVADVLRELFGSANTASEDIDQLCSRFGLANLVRSKAYIADDAVGLNSKVDAKVLKKIITGEPLTADRKNKDSVQFRFNGPAVITTNVLPTIKDTSHALYGRTVLLSFTRQFTADDAVRDFGEHRNLIKYLHAHGEFPGILNWAMEGLRIVAKSGHLPALADSADAADEWRSANDPVFDFLSKHCEYDPSTYNYVPALAGAISAYAELEHSDRTYTPRRCSQLLFQEALNVLPGVSRERKQKDKSPHRCVVGLRISEEGLGYLATAHEKGLFPSKAKWPSNLAVL